MFITVPQIKSFYSGMEIDDDSKPANKKKDGDKKTKNKQQKKNDAKPKPPTTIEGALQAVCI